MYLEVFVPNKFNLVLTKIDRLLQGEGHIVPF